MRARRSRSNRGGAEDAAPPSSSTPPRFAWLVALLALASAPRGVPQRPVIERRFVLELELATERFELGGTEAGQRIDRRPPRHVRQQASLVETADTPLDDAVPNAKFTRSYRTVTSSFLVAPEGEPPAKVVSAGLEGKRVTFARDEHGGYGRTCEDDEMRGGQLRRLRAELSLADWLPPADAAPDAAFELDFAKFARLLAPLDEGPNSRRAYSKRRPPATGFNVSPASLSEPLALLFVGAEGRVTGTPRAAGEGAALPRALDLEFRFENVVDGAESILAGVEGDAEDEIELVYTGTGTLSWDPESGVVEVACEGELEIRESFKVRVASATVEGEIVLAGTLELEGREERAGN